MKPFNNPLRLSYEQLCELLNEKEFQEISKFDSENNLVQSFDKENNVISTLSLPFLFPEISNELSPEWKSIIECSPCSYLILLIQSGSAALGYFIDGEVIDHKVIKKYMVRKSQGKSQLTHLKTKGKSRLGSRIRLSQSKQFFREINTKITSWIDIHNGFDKVILSCPVRLESELFNSHVPCPFQKNDERFMKLPHYISLPDYKILLHINYELNSSYLDIIDPKDESSDIIYEIIQDIIDTEFY